MNASVGERMGMKVRHFGYPWKRAQRAVETGQLDAMVTVPTKSRLNYAESSESTVYTIEMRPIVALGGAAEYKISSSSDPVTLKPKMECRIVDLPAPFGPIRQSDWPFATCRLKSCRISILP